MHSITLFYKDNLNIYYSLIRATTGSLHSKMPRSVCIFLRSVIGLKVNNITPIQIAG